MSDHDLLWRMYQDNRTQAQFHETQRANATALIVAGAGALITSINSGDGAGREDLPLAIMIVIVGLFGAVIAVKATERMRLHNKRCGAMLSLLDNADRTFNLVELKEELDRQHRRAHMLTSRVQLSSLWVGVHLLVALAGAVTAAAIIDPSWLERTAQAAMDWISAQLNR